MLVEVFNGRDGQWYVRAVARNGQRIVVSEGYTRKASALRAARRLLATLALASIRVV